MAASTVIQKTTDYSRFKTKKGNRRVLTPHVTRLVRSLERKNMLAAEPIVINEKWEIIDGQHRLAAAKRLNIPIYYTILNLGDLADIQHLNAMGKRWGPQDFLQSYIDIGKKDYEIYREFQDKYHFPHRFAVQLLMGENQTPAKSLQLFREGEFHIDNLKDVINIVNKIDKLLQFSASISNKTTRGQSARFYDSIYRLYKKDPTLLDRIHRQLIEHNLKIYRMDREKDYMRQFEDILNRGNYGKPMRLF